jgi:hypothetical protein
VLAALRERGANAAIHSWDDDSVDWGEFDAVIVRSTWDYAPRREKFVTWADTIGARLHNSPALLRWNSDKRYLADLASQARVVDTRYVPPGEATPPLRGEVVVKPSVSAGACQTGRFGPDAHELARGLIQAIHASGHTAMVQPYVAAIEDIGETAVVCIDGEPVHALRKQAFLRPDEVAPVRDGDDGAAEAMYAPGLVQGTEASATHLAHARALVAHVAAWFDYLPLYARVDTVPGADGEPMLLELELIEPYLYLEQVPATIRQVADAIVARATSPSG